MVETQFKNRIGSIAILIVGVLVSLEYAIGLINLHASPAPVMISFLISIIMVLACYLLQKVTLQKRKYSLELAAGLCLTLLLYFAIYNPFNHAAFWYGLIFYPILISLFENKAIFIRWTTIFLVVFSCFLLYLKYIQNISTLTLTNIFLFGIGTSLISTLIFHTNILFSEYRKNVSAKKKQQYVMNLLQTFIPTIERKTQINRNEILVMSSLIKLVMDRFPEEEVTETEAYLISLLHFVSRIKCPDYIFEKDGRLTSFEYQLVQEHCMFGNEIIGEIEEFSKVEVAFTHHHEKINGTGYPYGLKGDQIPVFSQTLGIVESYLAMINPRSYREGTLSSKAVIAEISRENSYDDKVVEALLSVLETEGLKPDHDYLVVNNKHSEGQSDYFSA
ncbi:hypothetical protein H1D32_21420 [Anaerobacillus sp. CMMVII]|uniref:HD-GYP domain-containing protein n=1 Tax=Anaerobacillus sp. CMMVII TaxID=2755588 RepID=UPI0021B7EEB6|nr:HD domain-containing phosphohydrolase [Anaerobacillus sp. CMMVII]MCT8140020.1 hypothetical protein [Anaerobacillus sp. CMMVII]